MFTQRHYEAIAKALAETHAESGPHTPAHYALGRLEAKLAAIFADDNERFNAQLFYKAAAANGFGKDSDCEYQRLLTNGGHDDESWAAKHANSVPASL